MSDDYEIRTFPAAFDGDDPNAETLGWLQAESQGFHDKKVSPVVARAAARNQIADGRTLMGVYAADRPENSLSADIPVATFASFEKNINLGHGRQERANLIASVTVRSTHRRRGILRRMMEANLATAHSDGVPLAALTASEASIYRRFGFGTATWTESVSVVTDARFQLITEPTGRCELVDPAVLETIAPVVFAEFHSSQAGSVDRQAGYWKRVSGLQGDDGEEDRAIRAAVHYSEGGSIDGYVSYKFSGWDATPPAIVVEDLVAVDENAYLALWRFLASIDLVETVTHETARVQDPLRWALSNPRLVSVKSVDDYVWLRILDPIVALQARGYSNEGSVTLRIVDSLGYASGTFRVDVAAGDAVVMRDDDAAADIELDVWVLGSLYLGGTDPGILRAAGQLSELTDGAVDRLRILFASAGPVFGITHF